MSWFFSKWSYFEIEEVGSQTTTREGDSWPELKEDVVVRPVRTYRMTNRGGQLVREFLRTRNQVVDREPIW